MEEIKLNTKQNSEEIKKKIKKRKVKRGFLIVLNAILFCYVIYCISDTIMEFYQKYFVNHDDVIISIRGYSTAKSMEIYDDVIDKDETGEYKVVEATDFSYYAGYLNFKSDNSLINKTTNELNYSSFDTYTLRRIDKKGEYQKINPYTNVQASFVNSIFLFDENLKEGDYLIYPYRFGYETGDESKQIPLKINSQKGIHEVYYSPLIDGKRRKFDIKSKASSPALVLSITNIYTPENSYYDLAILYKNDEEKKQINDLFSNDKFSKKFISSNENNHDDLIALYEAKANVTLILQEGKDITLSHYIDVSKWHIENVKNCPLSTEEYINVFDDDLFIRELGGNLFKAGSALPCIDESTKWLSGYKSQYDMGSLVIKVGIESLNDVKSLLENVENYNFL